MFHLLLALCVSITFCFSELGEKNIEVLKMSQSASRDRRHARILERELRKAHYKANEKLKPEIEYRALDSLRKAYGCHLETVRLTETVLNTTINTLTRKSKDLKCEVKTVSETVTATLTATRCKTETKTETLQTTIRETNSFPTYAPKPNAREYYLPYPPIIDITLSSEEVTVPTITRKYTAHTIYTVSTHSTALTTESYNSSTTLSSSLISTLSPTTMSSIASSNFVTSFTLEFATKSSTASPSSATASTTYPYIIPEALSSRKVRYIDLPAITQTARLFDFE